MKWYSNECHDNPMWCGRKNYVNKATFAVTMYKKRDNKDTRNDGAAPSNSKPNISNEFKIALAARTSIDDYISLEEWFFH